MCLCVQGVKEKMSVSEQTGAIGISMKEQENMMFRRTAGVLVAGIAGTMMLSMAGCQSDQTRRTDSNKDITLARRFNDADMKMIAKSMTTDALSRPWLEQAIAKLGRKPIIAVGEIRNKTDQTMTGGKGNQQAGGDIVS